MIKCPHCDHELDIEQIKSIWGSYAGKLQTPHAGPGRPRSEKRCPCGEMTKTRAKMRNHKCEAPKVRRKKAA